MTKLEFSEFICTSVIKKDIDETLGSITRIAPKDVVLVERVHESTHVYNFGNYITAIDIYRCSDGYLGVSGVATRGNNPRIPESHITYEIITKFEVGVPIHMSLNPDDCEKIYKFHEDLGYGSLTGIFIATPDDIKKLIGEEIYFGEINGKHSEVRVLIEESNFKIVSEDPDVIDTFRDNNMETGVNPLDYIE